MEIVVDVSELENFLKGKLADPERMKNAAANALATNVLKKAQKHTPRRTGWLYRGWHVSPAVDGVAVVSNNIQYAPYVEYGHRQEVGRYVPALGKRLVKGWVPGHHMLQKAVDETEAQKDAIVRRVIMRQINDDSRRHSDRHHAGAL